MPTGYVKKLAAQHHTSVDKSEARWKKAKAQAKAQGKGDNFAYITGIYKHMMGESALELSLKDFLAITEADDVSDISYGSIDDDENDLDISLDDLDGEESLDDDTDNLDDGEEHRLADVIGPEELDGELDGEEGDLEGENDLEGLDDEDEYQRFESAQMSTLKSLLMLNEKSTTKKLKKAAKAVYHRDYEKTKRKKYRQYDPKNRKTTSESCEDELSSLQEKWAEEYTVPEDKKGMFKGRTKAELEAELARLKASGPHKEGSKEYTREKELNFAIRAKSGWK